MNDLNDLYQETILDHARHPHNRGELANADAEGAGHNPVCGDEVKLQIAFDGDRLAAVRFRGSGCAISQASASMLTDAVTGRSGSEVGDLIERVERVLRGEEPDSPELGDLDALRGVAQFPMRVKCATLAWKTLRQALATANGAPAQRSFPPTAE